MEGVLLFFLIMGGVMALCWLVSGVDQRIQRNKGVEPNANGRIEDGTLSKVFLALVIGAGFFAYVFWGGSAGSVSGCFGSMRC